MSFYYVKDDDMLYNSIMYIDHALRFSSYYSVDSILYVINKSLWTIIDTPAIQRRE